MGIAGPPPSPPAAPDPHLPEPQTVGREPEPPEPPPPPPPPPASLGAEQPEPQPDREARPGPQIELEAVLRSLGPLLRRLTATDWLIAGGLLLLFVFSFLGGWIQTSYTCPIGDIYCAGSTASATGSLWEGFGVLPALIVVFAIVWFVAQRVAALRLDGIVPGSPIWRAPWMGFAGLEVVLFLLYWPIEGGTYSSLGSTSPGWALWASIAFAAVVGIGGYIEYRKSGGTPAGPAAVPGAGTVPAVGWQRAYTNPRSGGGAVPAPPVPPLVPAGTLSPDRTAWFDGATWQDASLSAPPGAVRSPDGNQWWDGTIWRAIPGWHVRAQGTEMLRPTPRVSSRATGDATGGGAEPGAGGPVDDPGGVPEPPGDEGPERQPPAGAPPRGAPPG